MYLGRTYAMHTDTSASIYVPNLKSEMKYGKVRRGEDDDDEEVNIRLNDDDDDEYDVPDMSPSFVVMAPPSSVADKARNYVRAIRFVTFTLTLTLFFTMASSPGLGSIFSWHPIFMMLGFVVFMTEGLLAYVISVPEISRSNARKRHGKFQVIALACVFVGYLAVFISHEESGKSHLGLDDNTSFSRGIHVFLGLSILILCIIQGVFGIKKYLRCVLSMFLTHSLTHSITYFPARDCDIQVYKTPSENRAMARNSRTLHFFRSIRKRIDCHKFLGQLLILCERILNYPHTWIIFIGTCFAKILSLKGRKKR